jgi:hypothetical protein
MITLNNVKLLISAKLQKSRIPGFLELSLSIYYPESLIISVNDTRFLKNFRITV